MWFARLAAGRFPSIRGPAAKEFSGPRHASPFAFGKRVAKQLSTPGATRERSAFHAKCGRTEEMTHLRAPTFDPPRRARG
jgi:hypothetical protein